MDDVVDDAVDGVDDAVAVVVVAEVGVVVAAPSSEESADDTDVEADDTEAEVEAEAEAEEDAPPTPSTPTPTPSALTLAVELAMCACSRAILDSRADFLSINSPSLPLSSATCWACLTRAMSSTCLILTSSSLLWTWRMAAWASALLIWAWSLLIRSSWALPPPPPPSLLPPAPPPTRAACARRISALTLPRLCDVTACGRGTLLPPRSSRALRASWRPVWTSRDAFCRISRCRFALVACSCHSSHSRSTRYATRGMEANDAASDAIETSHFTPTPRPWTETGRRVVGEGVGGVGEGVEGVGGGGWGMEAAVRSASRTKVSSPTSISSNPILICVADVSVRL